MTTELEQEFFKVFGIEPKWKDKRVKNIKTYYTEEQAQYLRETTKNRNIQLCYPEITDRILIELICLLSELEKFMITNEYKPFSFNKENLKANVLLKLADWVHWYKFKNIEDDIKLQIQQAFKEEE